MTEYDIPPQLVLPKSDFPRIRNGTKGIVFKISQNYAAKILFNGDVFTSTTMYELRKDSDAISELEYEADINSRLFDLNDNGIWVPEPLGVEALSIFGSVYPAFIMQCLPYPSGADLGFHEREKARRLALSSVNKTMDYGFEPGEDCFNPNNYLYDKLNQRAYLIDFERWTISVEGTR